jgi:Uma2 family endonuclease
MRALMLEVPPRLLEERRRMGADQWDEVWEGVLHMVPTPSTWHQGFGGELFLALMPSARARGLWISYETSLYRSDDNYRTPDIICALPSQLKDRGIEGGAEFVVEILSPNDESEEKLPFYEDLGVREALYVDPKTRAFTLHALRSGRLRPRQPEKKSGRVRSKALDLSFKTLSRREGPRLEVTAHAGSVTI